MRPEFLPGSEHGLSPGRGVTYLSPNTVEEVLTQAVFQAPLFSTRWRWNASRFLALLRHSGGKKVPAPLLRMRSDDLLAAVFPAQVQCQDNADPGDIVPPDHPLVFETTRDCLTEAMDLEGLKAVLASIRSGESKCSRGTRFSPRCFPTRFSTPCPTLSWTMPRWKSGGRER